MFEFVEKLGVTQGLRRIYAGEDALLKHMLLFLLVSIPAMLTTPLNVLSKQKPMTDLQFTLILSGLLIIAVMSVYIRGYLYGVMHNAFDENDESLLPKFDKSWFRVFFKGFPIQFVWFCYLVVMVVVMALITALVCGLLLPFPVGTASKISLAVAVTVLNIFVLSLPLIYSQFAENYDRKGLYNPILPIKYMFKSFKSFVILILTYAPAFLLIAFLGFLGTQNNVVGYLLTAVWTYLWTIMQYSANYCFVQIYKKEIRMQ